MGIDGMLDIYFGGLFFYGYYYDVWYIDSFC